LEVGSQRTGVVNWWRLRAPCGPDRKLPAKSPDAEPQLDPLSPPPDVEALEDGEAVDVIKEWFLFNFEDPTMETPRNDGEFTYIWGGPYDAREVIEDVYAGAASETVIEGAIRAVEDTGISDWAPHGRRVQPPEGAQENEPPAAEQTPAPAPDFGNPDELKRWLQAQPRDVVAVFAARAALRVLPTMTLAWGPSGSRMTRRMTILRAFRGVALAWATAAYPSHRDALRAAARAATNDSANVPILDAERAATFAAAATAIAGTRVSEVAFTAVTYALDAAGAKGSEAFELLKNALATDSDLLGRRYSPVTLAQSQLWPRHVPEWLQENWDRMRGDLLAADEGWDIWTGWYDDRLLGRAGNPTIEVARAATENQIWQEDPSTVNAHIKELIDGREIFEYATADELESGSEVPGVDSIPQQVAAASQFALDAEGRLDLVPDPPLADGMQREIYQEVRYKAVGLAALGHNQLADLSEPVNRFLAAAPERIEDVLVTRLWLRGNTLRIRLKAHETATASTDPTDPALFPTLVAEMLRDLVESFNIFIAGDAGGRELDQVRLGPQE
jgi:hypothetical protein